jgi:hypothetical protein
MIQIDIEGVQRGGILLAPSRTREEMRALVDVARPRDFLRQPGGGVVGAAGPEEVDRPGCAEARAVPLSGEEAEQAVTVAVDGTPERPELREEFGPALAPTVGGAGGARSCVIAGTLPRARS